MACQNLHQIFANYLLNNGINVNVCTSVGRNTLYVASFDGHDRSVDLLIKNGSSVNLSTRIITGPHYAA